MTSDLEGEEPDAGCRSPAPGDGVAQLIAGSGAVLLLRRIAIQAISAGSTAVLARTLSVKGFGAYSAGLAMYYVALSICDFGFGAVLGRELGQGSATDGSIVRGMLRIQTIWSGVVALGAVAFALFVGLGASKMQVLLVLSPAVALFGLNCVKQVFYASYKVGVLSRIDISTNVLQAIAVSLVALLGGSPAEVAAALSAVTGNRAHAADFVGAAAAAPTPPPGGTCGPA